MSSCYGSNVIKGTVGSDFFFEKSAWRPCNYRYADFVDKYSQEENFELISTANEV